MKLKQLITTGLTAAALAIPALGFADTFKEVVKDSVITAKIKAEMAKDKQVSATSVKVDTDANGMVQLSGTAKSQMEVDRAVSIANGTKGVTSVDNRIQIAPAK